MRTEKLRASAALLLAGLALLLLPPPAAVTQPQGSRWYKGNTHTHTLNTDGDSTPAEVVRWYRDQRSPPLVVGQDAIDAILSHLGGAQPGGKLPIRSTTASAWPTHSNIQQRIRRVRGERGDWR